MMKTFTRISVVFVLAFAVTNVLCAPSDAPLAIKVTNMAPGSPVEFLLDRKHECTADSNNYCIFSTDCGNFPGQPCIRVPIKRGKHLIKVDWGQGSLSKWVMVPAQSNSGADSEMPECVFNERMGDAKLFFDC